MAARDSRAAKRVLGGDPTLSMNGAAAAGEGLGSVGDMKGLRRRLDIMNGCLERHPAAPPQRKLQAVATGQPSGLPQSNVPCENQDTVTSQM